MKTEKWYIQIDDDNIDILEKFYKTLPVTHGVSFKGYLSNIDVTDDGTFLDFSTSGGNCKYAGCIKITIEDFLEMYNDHTKNFTQIVLHDLLIR